MLPFIVLRVHVQISCLDSMKYKIGYFDISNQIICIFIHRLTFAAEPVNIRDQIYLLGTEIDQQESITYHLSIQDLFRCTSTDLSTHGF